MEQSHYPLRINVGFILSQPLGVSHDIPIEFSHLHLHPDLNLIEFSGCVRLSHSTHGLLVQGDFQANIASQCVRCLADFLQHLHSTISELYAFNGDSVSESGLIFPEDGYLDLSPLVREYMILEIPIMPLCKHDCKGLCGICGENLNYATCEHMLSMAEK